jgi:hypothetical protein
MPPPRVGAEAAELVDSGFGPVLEDLAPRIGDSHLAEVMLDMDRVVSVNTASLHEVTTRPGSPGKRRGWTGSIWRLWGNP